jgi:hypothetical protein
MTDILALLAEARARWDAMSPAERWAQIEAQKRSYVIAEAGFGSDADEAAWHAAHASGNPERIAAEEAKVQARMEAARKYLEERDG